MRAACGQPRMRRPRNYLSSRLYDHIDIAPGSNLRFTNLFSSTFFENASLRSGCRQHVRVSYGLHWCNQLQAYMYPTAYQNQLRIRSWSTRNNDDSQELPLNLHHLHLDHPASEHSCWPAAYEEHEGVDALSSTEDLDYGDMDNPHDAVPGISLGSSVEWLCCHQMETSTYENLAKQAGTEWSAIHHRMADMGHFVLDFTDLLPIVKTKRLLPWFVGVRAPADCGPKYV